MFTTILLCAIVFSVSADLSYNIFNDSDSHPYKSIPIPALNPKENDQKYWKDRANTILNDKLNQKINTNTAKNIIFFLGDGLSIPTITAARIYQGQLKNKTGEEEQLFFETFPYTGLSKTYCVNSQVADSACTATAYMTGVKANIRTIGVTSDVQIGECENAKKEFNQVSSIVQWAQDAGKATGIVTNTRITHASPAGGYAHVPFRDMECDADVRKNIMDTVSCNFDIAKQLIYDEPGKNIKVLMGGGRNKFLPKSGIMSFHGNGSRLDEDLVKVWWDDKILRNANPAYIINATELNDLDISSTDYLLGLFTPEHFRFHLDNTKDIPTLDKMTEIAIKMLQKEKNGFYLFVEGGQIDFGHHLNLAHKALDETVEFAKAIEIASKLTNEEDTLIVVTADHAHTMSMSGYPARGINILGLYGTSEDGLPYATLSYANGPGYKNESSPGVRYNMSNDDTENPKYVFPAMVPKISESHGGDDVAVYARGPWAHLFTGNYEQNYIPIAEAYAARIDPSRSTEKIIANKKTILNFSHKNDKNYLLIIFSSMFVILINIGTMFR